MARTAIIGATFTNMLLTIVGDNRLEVLAELARQLEKAQISDSIRFSEDTFQPGEVLAALEQEDLFAGGEKAVVLDQLLNVAEGKEFLEENAETLAGSGKLVCIIEASIPAALAKMFKSLPGEYVALGTPKGRSSPPIFALSDAFGARDKKTLWLLYQDLLKTAEPEEIAGILAWQLKSMWLVQKGETTGLSPVVVSKARSFLKNYQPEEISKLHFKIVDLYHRGHQGQGDMEKYPGATHP